jgi:hypothetical protein
MSSPSSGQKKEAMLCFEMLVTTCKTAWHHLTMPTIPKNQVVKLFTNLLSSFIPFIAQGITTVCNVSFL